MTDPNETGGRIALGRVTIVVENANRELDAKLLLACFAAERGLSVVLGEKREIRSRAASLPRSVYLAKDVSHRSRTAHERVAWSASAPARLPCSPSSVPG